MTADVDVTVLLGGVRVESVLDALAVEEVRARFEIDTDFIERARVLPLIYEGEMPVDVVIGGPGLDEYFLERAEMLQIEGTVIRVPRREDLISMKLLAGRPQDIQDAQAMARAGSVDLDELRSFVEGMAEALADDAIRSRLDALLCTLE